MSYLLDTNVCIEILRGRQAALKARLDAHRLDELVLCSVVWAELHCGAQLAANPAREIDRLHQAFAGWPRLSFDEAAAESYGEIRARLLRDGKLIGANDLLIAAIAKANGLVVVTHNTGEFSRIPGLAVEDWQA